MEKKSELVSQRDKLLVSVGDCLHSWAFVELELSNLYMILHGIKRNEFSHPTRAAFEAVISLEVRLHMMCAYVAADISIKEDYFPHIKALSTQVFKLYKKRHEVAHFMVVSRNRKAGPTVMIRPFFTVNAWNAQSGSELDVAQITERTQRFGQLVQCVKRHVQHVGALRKLPPEYYVQAGDIAFPPLEKAFLSPVSPAPPLPASEE